MEARNPTNFVPNFNVLTSKRFTYYQLSNRLPSAGQTMWLHNLKSQVQAFFPALNNSFNIGTYRRTYTPILSDISEIGQYRSIISANWYIGQALIERVFSPLLDNMTAKIQTGNVGREIGWPAIKVTSQNQTGDALVMWQQFGNHGTPFKYILIVLLR